MYSGILFNIINNILFVTISYFIHYFLGSVSTPAEYGVIGTIITILDFEYLFLNNGARQSISNELSKQRYQVKDLLFKAFLFQILIIIIMFSINYFGANFFAQILSDKSLNYYFKVAAFIIPLNGIYVLFVGINEGIKCFKSGSSIIILYSIAKLSIVYWVLYGVNNAVLGTELGFITSNVVALITGLVTVFLNRSKLYGHFEEKIKFISYAKNALSFSIFFIIVSAVLSVDVLVVKAVVENENMAGFYTGALNFGKVSYFMLSSFFGIVIPVVTSYYTEGKIYEANETIKSIISLILTFIMPVAVIISASSNWLLTSFYSKEYISASGALSILAVSHFLMGIVVILNMIISSTGKKKFSSMLSILVLIADVPLCIVLTKKFGISGTALAGFLCTILALIFSYKYASKIFKIELEKKHIKMLFFNIFIWIALKVLSNYIFIDNIFILGFLYFVLYILTIMTFNFIKVINIKELIHKFLKN